jgi:hypothetical protein
MEPRQLCSRLCPNLALWPRLHKRAHIFQVALRKSAHVGNLDLRFRASWATIPAPRPVATDDRRVLSQSARLLVQSQPNPAQGGFPAGAPLRVGLAASGRGCNPPHSSVLGPLILLMEYQLSRDNGVSRLGRPDC